jgi:Flp pilus assembly protein CpaB
MSRIRLPLLIAGIVGALVVAVLIFVVIRAGRGTPIDLPIAITDIPPGTLLDPSMFRLQQVRGLEASTLDSTVEAGEFGAVVGHETLEMIHAGSPVLWAQIDPEQQTRLTLTLSDPTHLIYPLPVTADQVGDFLVAGDVVDVVFTLGRAGQQELIHSERWGEEGVPGSSVITSTLRPLYPRYGESQVHTTTLHLPVSKMILPDVPVLRVEREVVRTASASYGMGAGADESIAPATVEGDIIRLYLELEREQAEVLSFALHNGALDLPARAQPSGGESAGFTWDDFQDLFFGDRPEAELRGEE